MTIDTSVRVKVWFGHSGWLILSCKYGEKGNLKLTYVSSNGGEQRLLSNVITCPSLHSKQAVLKLDLDPAPRV